MFPLSGLVGTFTSLASPTCLITLTPPPPTALLVLLLLCKVVRRLLPAPSSLVAFSSLAPPSSIPSSSSSSCSNVAMLRFSRLLRGLRLALILRILRALHYFLWLLRVHPCIHPPIRFNIFNAFRKSRTTWRSPRPNDLATPFVCVCVCVCLCVFACFVYVE